MPELTAWDYGIGLILLISSAFGLWRGLVRTVFALAGWVAALLSLPFLGPIAVDAMSLTSNFWFAYVLVFLGVLIGVRIIGNLIARGVRSAGLGGLDRLLGGAIGVARAVLIIVVLVIGAKLSGLNEQASWKLALSRPVLEALLAAVEPYLPEQVSGIRRT